MPAPRRDRRHDRAGRQVLWLQPERLRILVRLRVLLLKEHFVIRDERNGRFRAPDGMLTGCDASGRSSWFSVAWAQRRNRGRRTCSGTTVRRWFGRAGGANCRTPDRQWDTAGR